MVVNHYAEIQKSILKTDGILVKIKNLKVRIAQKARAKDWATAGNLCSDLMALYNDLLAEKQNQSQHLRLWYQTEYDGPDMEEHLAREMAKDEAVMDKTRGAISNLQKTHSKIRHAIAVQYEEAGDLMRAVEIYDELELNEEAARVRLFMDM